MKVSTPDGGMHTEVHSVPFVGVSCDAPGSSRIAVLTGERTDDHLTHEIPNAVAVDLEPSGVSIRAADGSETQVVFRRGA